MVLAALLFAGFGLSLCARFHWFFDLFANFMIQYAAGGLALFFVLLGVRAWRSALVCLAVGLAGFALVQAPLHTPWRFVQGADRAVHADGPVFTIAHYNRLIINHRTGPYLDWVRAQTPVPDILVFHETGRDFLKDLQPVRDLYPYDFVPNRNILLLSRHPIKEAHKLSSPVKSVLSGMRVVVSVPGLGGDVVIYSRHPETPFGTGADARNIAMMEMAQAIAQDPAPYKILAGDFNMTPYSPYFRDLLKVSGLHYHSPGVLPVTTWPSFALLPFLKIPIDHVLYSDDLVLASLRAGPAAGSDHHPLLASFVIKPHDESHVESAEHPDH